jgi:hypothetical protein
MAEQKPLRLSLKLNGPLVEQHRLPLSELLRVGKQLRDSLRDVAIVLTHHGPSGTAGRARKAIEESIDLRVVGGPRKGSFVLELEAPPQASQDQEQLPTDLGPDLAERTVVTFLDGLAALDEKSDHLPPGFDRGVLRAVVPFKTALKRGVTEIALQSSRDGTRHAAKITAERINVAERLIKKPVKAETVAEGILQMVDFGSLECRIDRPDAPGISVYFDEGERDLVHEAVRQYVRVTGEGQFEPDRTEPTKIWASSIEVVHESLQLDVRAFWREAAIAELAEEQGAEAYALPEGLDEDPWRDDSEAAALIQAIHSDE